MTDYGKYREDRLAAIRARRGTPERAATLARLEAERQSQGDAAPQAVCECGHTKAQHYGLPQTLCKEPACGCRNYLRNTRKVKPLSVRQLFGRSRCDICEEPLRVTDEVAEFAPLPRRRKGTIAHADCGLSQGLELA